MDDEHGVYRVFMEPSQTQGEETVKRVRKGSSLTACYHSLGTQGLVADSVCMK